MLKKLICAALVCASIIVLASCGCVGSTTDTQPTSVKINEKMQIGELASYVTKYKWISESSDSSITFNDNGTIEGELNGKKLGGTFTQRKDDKKLGRLIIAVTPEGKKKAAEYTLDFINTAEMTFSDSKGKGETYKAEWAAEQAES